MTVQGSPSHCNWNFFWLELPQPYLWEQSLCELLCGGEKWKRSSTWHQWHYFPHCMRYGSAHRLKDTLSYTYLCFIHSLEAQVSLSKLPLEVLDQMISVDEGLGANQGDSGGSQTKQVSFSCHGLARSTKHVGDWAGSVHHHVGIGALISFAMADFTISTRDFSFSLYFHRSSHSAKCDCNFYHQLQGRIMILTQNLLWYSLDHGW